MRTFLTLNVGGFLSALLLGTALIYLGWATGKGLLFLLVMIYFLILSTLVTAAGQEKKENMGVYERGRGWKNVFANGIVPVAVAVLILLNIGNSWTVEVLTVSYVASISAIMSDKFASEIGILDGRPTMLLTMKPAKKGESGGVTGTGTLASLIGAFLISTCLIALNMPVIYIAIATGAGFIGNIVDSLFGYFEEHKIGNKYTSNMACAITGAALAYIILAVL